MKCPACNGEGEVCQVDGKRPAGWYQCPEQCGTPIDRSKARHRVSPAELQESDYRTGKGTQPHNERTYK